MEANCGKLFDSDVFLRWKLSAEPSSCLNTTAYLAVQIPPSGYDGSITFPNISPYSSYRVEVGIGNAFGYNNANSLESTFTTLQAGSKYSLCIFNILLDRKTQLSIELNIKIHHEYLLPDCEVVAVLTKEF